MCSDQLVNLVENTKGYHETCGAYVSSLRGQMDRVAKEAAKANAEWADDPKAEDHAAYHAPAEVQFPREVRDEAVLTLVKLHLARLAENDRLREGAAVSPP